MDTTTVSEERVEAARALVESYVEAWKNTDADLLRNHLDKDFVLHYFGNNPFTGSHEGKHAAIKTMATIAGITPRKLVAFDSILFGEDAAAIVVREELQTKRGSIQIRRVFRYRIEDDKFKECWLYEEDQDVVDEAWSLE